MGNFCNQAKVKFVDLKESKVRILFNVLRMRSIIKIIGIYLATAGLVIWLLGGARKGLYVISEEIRKVEPITEIEYSDRHDKFLPGIDFLFAGLILGGSFYLISFLFPKPLNSKTIRQS